MNRTGREPSLSTASSPITGNEPALGGDRRPPKRPQMEYGAYLALVAQAQTSLEEVSLIMGVSFFDLARAFESLLLSLHEITYPLIEFVEMQVEEELAENRIAARCPPGTTRQQIKQLRQLHKQAEQQSNRIPRSVQYHRRR